METVYTGRPPTRVRVPPAYWNVQTKRDSSVSASPLSVAVAFRVTGPPTVVSEGVADAVITGAVKSGPETRTTNSRAAAALPVPSRTSNVTTYVPAWSNAKVTVWP